MQRVFSVLSMLKTGNLSTVALRLLSEGIQFFMVHCGTHFFQVSNKLFVLSKDFFISSTTRT